MLFFFFDVDVLLSLDIDLWFEVVLFFFKDLWCIILGSFIGLFMDFFFCLMYLDVYYYVFFDRRCNFLFFCGILEFFGCVWNFSSLYEFEVLEGGEGDE